MSQPVTRLREQFRRHRAGRRLQGCGRSPPWWTDCDKSWSPTDGNTQWESQRKRSGSRPQI